jgi:hypothetical protein
MTDHYFYECQSLGKWRPVVADQHPDMALQKPVKGTIRNVVKLPPGDVGMPLELLRRLHGAKE